MVMTRLRVAVVFAVVVMAAGCYDTPAVNPYPNAWLIDNFEDENGYPSSPLFENWECRPQDPTHRISDCKPVADPDGTAGNVLHLSSTLWPQEGNGEDFIRSEVATFAKRPLDLTPYASLEFRAKLARRDSFTPILRVLLSCTDVQPRTGGISRNPCVVKAFEGLPVDWRENKIGLSEFDPPELSGPKVSAADCLAKVDGIKITVDSKHSLEKGSSAGFDLYVDDIKFTPKP